jgi:secreted trypsin-like serine protease
VAKAGVFGATITRLMPRSLGMLVALAALALGGAAQAVVGGTLDQTHTYVGAATQVQTQNGVTGTELCSGTLISQTVFLTAAHCFPDGSTVTVTFDSNFRTPATTYTGTVHDSTQADVAVIVFDTPITTVGLAQLPAAGFDDTLPNNQLLDVVGYGVQTFNHRMPIPPSGFRQMTMTTVKSAGNLGDQSLKLLADPGACLGDSGGPNFVDGTNIIAAITTGGNDNCKGVSYALRVDTQIVRDFLSAYVTLP